MNFLKLCQEARRECVGNAYSTTVTPTTTVNQQGFLGDIVEHVRQGWVDLQRLNTEWKFLRATKVYVLTINTRTYDLLTDLALQYLREFDKNGLFIEELSSDKVPLGFEEWEVFRNRVISTVPGRPSVCAVNPDNQIEFDVIPDKAYTVRLSHWLTAELLDDDDDVPSIADDYHEAIVWQAVLRYAGNDTAGELYQHAAAMRDPIITRMTVRYLPLPNRAGPCPPVGL